MQSAENLLKIAEQIIDQTIAELPPEIRSHAENLPLDLLEKPTSEMIAEQIEEDTLGLFIGDSLADFDEEASPMPAQILLFYQNIWDFAENDLEAYKEEIRITFLHELGHYFGWDEQDLYDRDLD